MGKYYKILIIFDISASNNSPQPPERQGFWCIA